MKRIGASGLGLLFMILVALPSVGNACGLATHEEVAQRTLRAFASQDYRAYDHYLAEYQDALQAGVVFPDWGYAFGYGDEAEEAHWDPFIKAAANYIHATHPKPWNTDTQRLAVFLLGVMSHSMADIPFHALGRSEGFLEAMAQLEFGGSFEDAHGVGDFGGDVVCTYALDFGWMSPVWYIPVQDLVEIYHQMGYPLVTAESLTACMYLQYLGAQAERLGGGLLFPVFAGQSPFLVDHFQDYFIGGLDDMAVWSSWRWHETIDWMENGVAASSTGRVLSPFEPSRKQLIDEGLKLLARKDLRITTENVGRGVFFRLVQQARPDQPKAKLDPAPDGARLFTSSTPYAYLGTGLAAGDFNGDGKPDLAMGAPGYGIPGHPQLGAAYIVYGSALGSANGRLDLAAGGADMTLTGTEDYGRFGWAVAAIDLNADGLTDLAVSAPTSGSRALAYQGKVYIYLGHGDGLAAQPEMVIDGGAAYTNLGWDLTRGDCNADGFADLIIGAPFARAGGVQRGLAAVFLGAPTRTAGSSLSLDDADWLASGTQDYAWFGYHMELAGGRLLVGAPAADRQQGRLYGFDLATGQAEPLFTLRGDAAFGQLAASFACGDPYGAGRTFVALASPTARAGLTDQAGTVMLLPLDSLKGDQALKDLKPSLLLLGDQAFARLGWQVGFADWNGDGRDDLLVTENLRATARGVETGAAYLWLGGRSFPRGLGFPWTASVRAGGTPRTQFGSACAVLDFNGDGCSDLAVAARHASTEARLSGMVMLLISPYGTAASGRRSDPSGLASEAAAVPGGADSQDKGCFIRTAL